VQEKRERAYLREEGWELVEGEWCRISDLEDEEMEPARREERSRSPSIRQRSHSSVPSLTSDEIRRELDEALRAAQHEAAARRNLEERLKTLEEALLARTSAGTDDAPYTPMHVDINTPAPPSEAALSEEVRSQALSGSSKSQVSQALSASQPRSEHSRVASEPASEVIQFDTPLAGPLRQLTSLILFNIFVLGVGVLDPFEPLVSSVLCTLCAPLELLTYKHHRLA
jgi:hypothetical protein